MKEYYVIYNRKNSLWFRRGREEIFGERDWADDLATILTKEEAEMYLNLLNDKKVLDKTTGYLAVRINITEPDVAQFLEEDFDRGNVLLNIELMDPDFTETIE